MKKMINQVIAYNVLSCMNPSIDELKWTVKPTYWDKIQFILKWGI